jgi:hypothetical protein
MMRFACWVPWQEYGHISILGIVVTKSTQYFGSTKGTHFCISMAMLDIFVFSTANLHKK